MKASEIGCSAKTNGIADDDTSKFGFNLDAHSFELLSKNLYSDGILACVREYTTNAIDSLKESGNEGLGYIVHLPNRLEPFFSIRDTGSGIPPEKMPDLFTFNHSDKRKTNRLSGTFGLGSKSFLAISDSANFTTYFNGMKTVFFVYKDKGIPTYTKIEESETDEPNGLEVKIPIADNQHYTLIETYNKFCRFVEIQPTITGYSKEQWDASLKSYKDKTIDVGDGCFFNTSDRFDRDIKVVFGSVAYRIPRHRISGFIDYNCTCIINIPIGSVDIVPSREELRMTDKTMQYITKLGALFGEQVQKRIDEVYKKDGFIAAYKYINGFISKQDKFKINGKEQVLDVISSRTAKYKYNGNGTINWNLTQRKVTIDAYTRVVLDFEEKLTNIRVRIKEALNNSSERLVVISDKEEAKKYCEHFEVDINTLTHLKDVVIPKRNVIKTFKENRFTGLRSVCKHDGSIVEEADVEISNIDKMYFVYRKGNKIYSDTEYLNEVTNIRQIMGFNPWKDKTIYALTTRQFKKCQESNIEMINLLKDVKYSFDKDMFDKAMCKDAIDQHVYYFKHILTPELSKKVLPKEFQIDSSIMDDSQYRLQKMYLQLGIGDGTIAEKYQNKARDLANSDIGRLISVLAKSYNAPSKEFIQKILHYSATELVEN